MAGATTTPAESADGLVAGPSIPLPINGALPRRAPPGLRPGPATQRAGGNAASVAGCTSSGRAPTRKVTGCMTCWRPRRRVGRRPGGGSEHPATSQRGSAPGSPAGTAPRTRDSEGKRQRCVRGVAHVERAGASDERDLVTSCWRPGGRVAPRPGGCSSIPLPINGALPRKTPPGLRPGPATRRASGNAATVAGCTSRRRAPTRRVARCMTCWRPRGRASRAEAGERHPPGPHPRLLDTGPQAATGTEAR